MIAELGKGKKQEIETLRTMQNTFGEDTVALYTITSEDRYRIILTSKYVQIDGKTEISSADLNKKIFTFRNALQNPNIDPRPLGKELYDILIKPIEKDLKATGAKTLLWSLDSNLRYIPIAALYDGQSYMVEKYNNVNLTPRSIDTLNPKPNPNKNVLAMGVSESQRIISTSGQEITFASLPGVSEELNAIVKNTSDSNEGVLPGTILLNSVFTKQSFEYELVRKSEQGESKYNIVHIASHFYLGSTFSDSFFVLGDGKILTLEELNYNPSFRFDGIDLIVLSSSNTGFSISGADGKEIDGLVSVLQRLGAKSVMSSLWSVSDQSTPILMKEFYKQWANNPNMTKSEALRLAQISLLNETNKNKSERQNRTEIIEIENSENLFRKNAKTPFAHPYYWSSFVVYGNWK